MKREELIKALKDWKPELELMAKYNDNSIDYQRYRALDEAITELEQEPCEDCISRQAVLDMVEDMTDQFGNKHRVVTEGMISLLPSVTPKLRMVQNPCVECGCNYCTNDDCENRYIVDIAESEDKK